MIRSSEKIDEIAKALNVLQANILEVEKTEENPAFKKDGKASKYSTLVGSWRLVRPFIRECGLSIMQMPAMNSGFPCLTTRVMHISGQWIESDCLLNPAQNTPQGLVGAITYFRRACFNSILGVVPIGEDDGEDDDDDGNAISGETIPAPTSGLPKPIVTGQALGSNYGGINYKNYIVDFGKKYPGKRFLDIPDKEKDSYAKYLIEDAQKQKKPLGGAGKTFVDMATAYFADIDKQAEGDTWETEDL